MFVLKIVLKVPLDIKLQGSSCNASGVMISFRYSIESPYRYHVLKKEYILGFGLVFLSSLNKATLCNKSGE
jgi:hypothetical protein